MTKQERQHGTLVFGMNNQQWQECWMDLGSWNQTCPNLGARNARFSAADKATQLDQLNDLLEIHGPHQSLFFFPFLRKLLSFSDLNFPHEGSQVQIMHPTDASKPTTC